MAHLLKHPLRDRLRRIREMQQGETVSVPESGGGGPDALPGWERAGFQTLRRVSDMGPVAVPAALPAALPVIVPDCAAYAEETARLPAPEELLFFDLETTGLSGGAGTVAFLAAFGRLVGRSGGGGDSAAAAHSLRVTQYLLLDYPGESDFIAAVLAEIGPGRPMLVSYNGKSFDTQILTTRCLMNGIRPPQYRQADLLHPTRRLWQRVLCDCSQGTIESAVLGIDREGDTPGALAPEIWFSFLRTGEAAPLEGICDHNRRDIAGLAALFAALCRIAADPCEAAPGLAVDIERLALRWRDFTRRKVTRLGGAGNNPPAGDDRQALRDTGTALLRHAAETGHPLAALRYALDLLREGAADEGRGRLAAIAESDGAACPVDIRIAALRSLSIDSERRLGDAAEALLLAQRALELLPPGRARRNEFERRQERLMRKTLRGR